MHVLVHIPYSPWSFRARQALDAQGITWRGRHYLPTLGEPGLRLRLRQARGPVTVPVLLPDDGPPITDSFAIAEWAAARSNEPLVTDGTREACRRWNAVASGVMEAGRARTTVRVRTDPVALQESLPGFLQPLGPVGRFVGRDATARILRKYGADAASPEVWHARMADGLRQLRDGLAGRPWLLDGFSYADVTGATALAFVRPHAEAPLGPRSRVAWTEPDLAETYADLLGWRDAVVAEVKRRCQSQGGRSSSSAR